MTDDVFEEFDCDLCGSPDCAEIGVTAKYAQGEPLHACKACGFVFVRRRRAAQRIADVWSDEIYEKSRKIESGQAMKSPVYTYTSRIPAIKARQTYVAEFIDTTIGLGGKTVCDIGAGEGQFLDIIKGPEYGASVFAIEPSAGNCAMMKDRGIEIFCGIMEDYRDSDQAKGRRFDIATIVWTLENCQSCRAMVDAAYDAVNDEGHVVIATGSRILAPFKKPILSYLGSLDPKAKIRPSGDSRDAHCFRFSANALRGLLAVSGFEPVHINHYIDTDYLVAIGRKTDRSREIPWKGDDYREVIDFFERWDKESREHYEDTFT